MKFLTAQEEKCDISDFDLEVEKGVTIKVFVIKPKGIAATDNAGYIYGHGGGGVMMTAETENPIQCHVALTLNCVLFNVDYRLGPEVKCPTGQEDFVKAIEHIHENAASFGVDAN